MLICGAESPEERRSQILSVLGFERLSAIEIEMQLTETVLAMAVQKTQISIKDYFFMLGIPTGPQPIIKPLIPPEPILIKSTHTEIKIQTPTKQITKVILPSKPLVLPVITRNPLQYLYLNTVFVTISTLEKRQAPKEIFKDIGLSIYVVDQSPQQKHQQIINTLLLQFPEIIIDTPIITQTPAKKLQVKTLEAILQMPAASIMILSEQIPHLLQYAGAGKFLVALPEIKNIYFEHTAFQKTGRIAEKYYTKFFELLLKLRKKQNAGHSELIDAHIERLMYQVHTKNGQLRKRIAQYILQQQY